MDFKNREVLTIDQKMKVAKEFLEKMEYFELNPKLVLETKAMEKIIVGSRDKFEVVKHVAEGILVITKEVEEKLQKLKEEADAISKIEDERRKVKKMTIMQVAIADAENLTVGQFIKKLTERYTEANFMDTPISKILCEDADIMLTKAMVANPTLINTTFQNENFNAICKYADSHLKEQTKEEEKIPEVSKEELTEIANKIFLDIFTKVYR